MYDLVYKEYDEEKDIVNITHTDFITNIKIYHTKIHNNRVGKLDVDGSQIRAARL